MKGHDTTLALNLLDAYPILSLYRYRQGGVGQMPVSDLKYNARNQIELSIKLSNVLDRSIIP